MIRDIYEFISDGARSTRPPAVATFEDGLRSVRIVEAMLASARAGNAWTAI